MMLARRTSAWRGDYEVLLEGRPVATFARSTWRGGGVLEADGRRYEVRSNAWGTDYTLAQEGGDAVASAQRVGRKEWAVDAEGVTYRFRRTSVWRLEHELVLQGAAVGSVRGTSLWRGDVEADLPGLPTLVALFTVAVVVTTWELAATG